MSNQHTGLPNTPEEIRAFIGKSFSSLQFGQETEQPHDDDTYTLTAHDLISAFQWLEIDAPVSAEPVGEIVLFGGDSDLKEVSWRKGKMPPPGTKLYTAPVAAQPDVTQQTLDDVKAGIPARDAEIEALRKEIETLRTVGQQASRPEAVPGNSEILDLAISEGMSAKDGVYCGSAATILCFAGALTRAALAQQDADKVDSALAEMVHAMFRSGNDVPVTRITIDRKQYEAAIETARKEQA